MIPASKTVSSSSLERTSLVLEGGKSEMLSARLLAEGGGFGVRAEEDEGRGEAQQHVSDVIAYRQVQKRRRI